MIPSLKESYRSLHSTLQGPSIGLTGLGNPVGVSTGVTVLDLPKGETDQIILGDELGDPAILRFRDPGCRRAGEIHNYPDQ